MNVWGPFVALRWCIISVFLILFHKMRIHKNHFKLLLGEPPRDVKPVMTGWFHINDSRVKPLAACRERIQLRRFWNPSSSFEKDNGWPMTIPRKLTARATCVCWAMSIPMTRCLAVIFSMSWFCFSCTLNFIVERPPGWWDFKGYDPLRTPIVPRRFSFCKDGINPSTGMLTGHDSWIYSYTAAAGHTRYLVLKDRGNPVLSPDLYFHIQLVQAQVLCLQPEQEIFLDTYCHTSK